MFITSSLNDKGDSDLSINNCLIDFKITKKNKFDSTGRAQLFAFAFHKFMRNGRVYDKIYIFNPHHYMLEELVQKIGLLCEKVFLLYHQILNR